MSHAKDESHLSSIPYRNRVTLRHVKRDEGDRLCTAVEDIAALGRCSNSWMTTRHITACQDFVGTEAEAVELRNSIERDCSNSLNNWDMYQ